MKKLLLLTLVFFLIASVSATDVAYVLHNTGDANPRLTGILNDLELDYDLIAEIEVLNTDFGAYEFILIDDRVDDVPITEYKTMILHSSYYEDFSKEVGSLASTQPLRAMNIDLNSSIVDGMEEEFQVYTHARYNGISVPMYYLTRKTYDVNGITSPTNSPRDFVIATKHSPRRVFFGPTAVDYWTDDTEQIFKNAISWILIGEDRDGDGYLSDEDCDDNDPTVNPASQDVYKNCKNDAPILELIDRIIVNETETVEIVVNAIDPENDELNYSINDARFSLEGNVFTWETDEDDQGDYFFIVTVSDGEFSRKAEVGIRVNNLAPFCEMIPTQEWAEDTNHTLDLTTYCSDPDDENLSYYVADTSDDSHITITSIINGIVSFIVDANWFGEDWIIFGVSDGLRETETNSITLNVTNVNDEPTKLKDIEDISFDEDTIYEIDLREYFEDIDSVLSYGVSGDDKIDFNFEDGIVILTSEKDWYGVEDVFITASDGEFSLDSNVFSIEVFDIGEPPEFGEMNCNLELLEDVEESCELIATDFEGDDFEFSVRDETNLNCEVDGIGLTYVSRLNYFGEASCLIRVQDNDGYNEFLLEVNITAVNDAPEIESYFPLDNPRIIDGRDQLFSVNAFDVDSQITINWVLGGQKVGEGEEYVFQRPAGNYVLYAEATDGVLSDRHTWQVVVGDTSEFTCFEVGGKI